MSSGNGDRQRYGVVCPVSLGTKNTPPIPSLAASQAPSTLGSPGTNSAILVGRLATSRASHLKSASTAWISFVRRSLGRSVSSWRNASCSRENNPLHPGMAMDIERSSPSTLCQVFLDTVRCRGLIESNISNKRDMRCGGNVNVFSTVSMSHPSIVFRVDHVPSPFLNFLIDAGSCRMGWSRASSGRKILSKANSKARLMR